MRHELAAEEVRDERLSTYFVNEETISTGDSFPDSMIEVVVKFRLGYLC